MTTFYHAAQQQVTQLSLFDSSIPDLPRQTCTKCGDEQPLENFELRKDTNRYRTQCRECIRELACINGKKRRANQAPCIPDFKYCPRCQQTLSSVSFHRNRSCKDGLQAYCYPCQKAYEQEKWDAKRYNQQYRQENKERIRERKKEYYQENKDTIKAHAKAYRQEHPEKVKERKQREYQANREAIIERNVQYNKEHKDTHYARVKRYSKTPQGKQVSKESSHRRRARINDTTSDPVDYAVILERDGAKCYICGQDIDLTLNGWHLSGLTFDHEKPLAGEGERKGTHSPENVHPAHRVCNIRKGTKLLSELSHEQRRGPDA